MSTIVNRKDIKDKFYRDFLKTESHHDHKIIKDENGTLRWEENEQVSKIVDKIGLND